jgi:hypothetical protein
LASHVADHYAFSVSWNWGGAGQCRTVHSTHEFH